MPYMGTLTASTYSVGEQIMKHKFQFSYKRQKLLTFTLVGSSLLVCLMSQAREFPSIKLPQKEYRLTGTSLQSVKEIVPYYDSCNTVYDDSLYQGEIVVTQEGTAGKQETTALITYLNGHAVSEEIIDCPRGTCRNKGATGLSDSGR